MKEPPVTSSPTKRSSSDAGGSRKSSSKDGNNTTAKQTVQKSGTHQNPVVASLNSSASSYNSIGLSPCRDYAALACKDSLQMIRISPEGLQLIKTIVAAPFFQQSSASNKAATATTGGVLDPGSLLNLRDFALGSRSTTVPSASTLQNDTVVVITDVAWSTGRTLATSDLEKESAAQQHSLPEWRSKFDDSGELGDRRRRLRTSMIAAAGSNGIIVIWNAAPLLDAVGNAAPVAILNQHNRQVNRLAWHPGNDHLLLSASQDWTVVLWERRAQKTESSSKSSKHRSSDAAQQSAARKSFFGALVPSSSSSNSHQPNKTSAKLAAPSNYQWHSRTTFAPKSEAVRDIQWSPFYEDVFALVTTSGNLIVYNQFVTARAMIKMAAHSGDASTVDWHPVKPYILATGGASDRSVKVWDLEKELSILHHNHNAPTHSSSREEVTHHLERNSSTGTSRGESVGTNESSTLAGNDTGSGPYMTMGASTSISMLTYGTRTLSSVSSTGNMNNSRHRNMSKNMLYVLSISASVTRIRWRPVANETTADGEDRHDAMIAVATAQIKGASAGGAGLLSLWSYHRPYMPLSVVEGHQDGAVVDFDWLDTPKSRDTRFPAPDVTSTSRIPGVLSHEVDSILYDSSGFQRNECTPCRFWQHVISVGRDGNCFVQSLVRGDRPISRVPPSCFAMANLSPFQKGYGSLQIFSVCQPVPSGLDSDTILTNLRRDRITANAPGIFREISPDNTSALLKTSTKNAMAWRAGTRLPEETPSIVFNVLDHGDLDDDSNPIIDDSDKSRFRDIVVAPEVVHLSRFAERYKLYPHLELSSRSELCQHNADVAESLSQHELAHMWRIVGSMLESCGEALEINETTSRSCHQYNGGIMEYVFVPTMKALLEERANAGDVQTCVALCEVLQVVREDQTVHIPKLDIALVREWYLSYIDLLRDMCLFSHATFLIRNCRDPFIGALNQQSTIIHESCPHCGKALMQEETSLNNLTDSSYMARRVCKSCRRRVGLCFICHEPVKGVFVWCPGCGHGGHLEHALEWFGGGNNALRTMCPTGCGHQCNLIKDVSAFPRTESFI